MTTHNEQPTGDLYLALAYELRAKFDLQREPEKVAERIKQFVIQRMTEAEGALSVTATINERIELFINNTGIEREQLQIRLGKAELFEISEDLNALSYVETAPDEHHVRRIKKIFDVDVVYTDEETLIEVLPKPEVQP